MVKMRKNALMRIGWVVMVASLSAGGARTAILGPDSAVCAAGKQPAILVKVIGLKNRDGKVRARTFSGDPSTYFDKRFALTRTEMATPPAGSVEICIPVSKPGRYAVDVRHDVDNDGKTSKADGAGTSGNPEVSFLDVVLKHRPPASEVEVSVGNGVTVVPVIVRYLQGGSLKPITEASR